MTSIASSRSSRDGALPMKLAPEDIATGALLLACEFAWNGMTAHLSTSPQIQEVLQVLNPIVHTAVIVFAVCYVIARIRTVRRQAQWDSERESLKKRVSELESRLHAYDAADARVQVAVDVEDYLEANANN